MTPDEVVSGSDGDALVDLEIALVKAYGWSLYEIGETPIEMLLPFIRRVAENDRPAQEQSGNSGPKTNVVHIDEVMHWFR